MTAAHGRERFEGLEIVGLKGDRLSRRLRSGICLLRWGMSGGTVDVLSRMAEKGVGGEETETETVKEKERKWLAPKKERNGS